MSIPVSPVPESSRHPQSVSEDDSDRRIHPRIMEPPLHVSGLWATVLDVSEGGICLKVAEVQPGEVYELILTDAINHHTQDIQAVVIWSRGGRAGLRWQDPSPQEEIWLRNRFETWLKEGKGRLKLNRRP